MPDPRDRGANRNRWPPWAIERARWIRAQLEQGASLGAIAELVRHGFGVPSPPILDDATAEPAPEPEPVRVELDGFDLGAAERRLCQEALERALAEFGL